MTAFELHTDRVSERKLGSKTILFPISSDYFEVGRLFELQGISQDIWRLMKDGKNEEEILEQILEEFDVERDVAAGDLEKVINSLEYLKIITRKN